MLDIQPIQSDIMNKEQARTLLRYFAPAMIRLTRHCRKRMRERDVSMDDILSVLNWGKITDLKWNEECQNWECTIEGKDTDGEDLIFVAAIDEEDRSVLCITVR